MNEDRLMNYLNTYGKTIGKITASETIFNPNTQQNDTYITLEIPGLEKICISVHDDISDERLKAFAAYRRECLMQDMKILQEKLDRINEYLEESEK